jgi:hypothetical protein
VIDENGSVSELCLWLLDALHDIDYKV